MRKPPHVRGPESDARHRWREARDRRASLANGLAPSGFEDYMDFMSEQMRRAVRLHHSLGHKPNLLIVVDGGATQSIMHDFVVPGSGRKVDVRAAILSTGMAAVMIMSEGGGEVADPQYTHRQESHPHAPYSDRMRERAFAVWRSGGEIATYLDKMRDALLLGLEAYDHQHPDMLRRVVQALLDGRRGRAEWLAHMLQRARAARDPAERTRVLAAIGSEVVAVEPP